ncbi:MAG: DUF2752 domain-containing protein [Bacteroidales bacterium]|nr:DUF2752 domain-containing protein [Bacteroidales bacterium]
MKTVGFKKKHIVFVKHSIEAIIWIVAILLLAFDDPTGGCHYSLCLFKNLGLSFCPGCGLGHAISWLFRGEFSQSVQAHPLGIPALFVLIYRIFVVFSDSVKMVKIIYS